MRFGMYIGFGVLRTFRLIFSQQPYAELEYAALGIITPVLTRN